MILTGKSCTVMFPAHFHFEGEGDLVGLGLILGCRFVFIVCSSHSHLLWICLLFLVLSSLSYAPLHTFLTDL